MAVKKILIITSGYPNVWKPSSGIFIKRQVEFLEASGDYCFDVLSTGDSRKGIYSFVKYIRLTFQVLGYSLFHNDFDLIHAHEVLPAGLLALIPKVVKKKKLVITFHGGPLYSLSNKKDALLLWLILAIVNHTDKSICVSQYLLEQITHLFHVKEEKAANIQVINMGVALDQFHPFPKNEARIRLGLDFIDPNKKIVMFVGRLIERKGGVYLIKVAKILQEKNMLKNLSVVFVGAGPEEKKLKAEALRLGVYEDILFVGAKPPEEIYLWMSAADLITVPSLNEGFGLVALEAMACGTPVISTNVGGLKEFVKHGESGLLVEKQDANELAEGIISLLNDLPLYRKIVENGLEVARQNSAERQAFKVGKIYQDLVNSGAKN